METYLAPEAKAILYAQVMAHAFAQAESHLRSAAPRKTEGIEIARDTSIVMTWPSSAGSPRTWTSAIGSCGDQNHTTKNLSDIIAGYRERAVPNNKEEEQGIERDQHQSAFDGSSSGDGQKRTFQRFVGCAFHLKLPRSEDETHFCSDVRTYNSTTTHAHAQTHTQHANKYDTIQQQIS